MLRESTTVAPSPETGGAACVLAYLAYPPASDASAHPEPDALRQRIASDSVGALAARLKQS
jgi:hypothetical protein